MLLLSQTELPATQSGIRSASPRPPAHSQVRGTRAPAAPPRSPTCTPHRSIPRTVQQRILISSQDAPQYSTPKLSFGALGSPNAPHKCTSLVLANGLSTLIALMIFTVIMYSCLSLYSDFSRNTDPRANLTCNCIASFQRQVILATCLWTHSAFPPATQNKSKNTGHSRNGDDMFILADACLLHVVVEMQTCNTGLAHKRFTIKFVQMKYLQNAIKPQLTLQLLADESS